MFGIENISVNFLTGSPVITSLALVVFLALSVYLYRRTNPPLALWLRIALGALRVVAVLALFLALFEPVVSYTRDYVRPHRVALMVDRSLSMDRTEAGKTRAARTDSLLSGQGYDALRRAVDVTPYYFGGGLAEETDGVDRNSTALGDALYDLDQLQLSEPNDYWLVLSDGNSNAGRQPAEVAKSLHTPIIAVDLAAGQGTFDVGLQDIEFNPVQFAGRPNEIRAKLNWRDAQGKTVTVRLMDSTRTLDSEPLSITQESGVGEVTLKYTPDAPGQKLLKVSIQPQQGEEMTGNNERSISIKVLKSRLMVLLAVKHPDYEVGFLKRLLDGSDKYDVDLIATGSKAGNLSGRFPTKQTELNRYDLVILYDPDPADLTSRRDIINSYLNEKGGALWVMMGPDYAARGPVEWFNDLLPFSQSAPQPIQYVQFHAEPIESHLFHPAIRLADNQAAVREAWASLPPFRMLVACDHEANDAVILANASIRRPDGQPLPALGYSRKGPGKVFATAVLPFWPWGFVNLGFGEDDSNYRRFVEGTVGWLTVKDDFDPVRVRPEKEVFTRGEPVVFNGFAYDLGYRPIPGAGGVVKLTGGPDNESFETDLSGTGDGTYKASFENLAPGRYKFAATVEKDGQTLKTDNGTILVEPFSLEEFDQSGDPAALASIARLTGGSSYDYKDFDKALAAIDRTDMEVSSRHEVNFWGKLWLLLVLIGALSVEWLLRKANQLV